jgi:hypothetical protein
LHRFLRTAPKQPDAQARSGTCEGSVGKTWPPDMAIDDDATAVLDDDL